MKQKYFPHLLIIKRTFDAKTCIDKDLKELLNAKSSSSEYMPSYKYSIIGKKIDIIFRTKKEAEEWIKALSKPLILD